MEENTGQAISIDEECSEVPTAERRTIPRAIIPVKRTVLATISGMDGDEEQQLYLHINDISEKGMRITTDIFVPEDNRIRLRFLFDKPLEIEARTVWAKELGKGNYVMGLELFQDSEINKKYFGPLMEWAHPQEQRNIFYLRRSLSFEGNFNGHSKRFFAHVVSLSPEGMEITCDICFPIGEQFSLTFTVEEKEPPRTVGGKVVFQDKISTLDMEICPILMYRTWIEFLDHEPGVEEEDALEEDALEEEPAEEEPAEEESP